MQELLIGPECEKKLRHLRGALSRLHGDPNNARMASTLLIQIFGCRSFEVGSLLYNKLSELKAIVIALLEIGGTRRAFVDIESGTIQWITDPFLVFRPIRQAPMLRLVPFSPST